MGPAGGSTASRLPERASISTTAFTLTPSGEGWAASKILSQMHAVTSVLPTCTMSRNVGYTVWPRKVGLIQVSGGVQPARAVPLGRNARRYRPPTYTTAPFA